jgi:peptidoglycan/LPS O-acetylase OafA/YrhL
VSQRATLAVPKIGVHVPALDGLRGLAILLVMACHFTMFVPRPKGAVGYGLRMLYSGWTGVDLFFVLSGFLITGILYDTKGATNALRNFYVRRILRIFPLYLGVLVIIFVALPMAIRGLDGMSWRLDSFLTALDSSFAGTHGRAELAFWLHASNILAAIKGHLYAPGHFWSLAVEEQFYLVWPFIVFAFRRETLTAICASLVVAALICRVCLVLAAEPVAAFVTLPCRMDPLAIGAFLALAARAPRGLEALTTPAKWILAICGVLWGAIFIQQRGWPHDTPVVQTVGYSVVAMFYGALMIVALAAPGDRHLGWLLRQTWLRFVGKISYGIYVFHGLIFVWLLKLIPLSQSPAPTRVAQQVSELFALPSASSELGLAHVLDAVAYIALATILSVAVAWLSWNFYEKHFLQLKRGFSYTHAAHAKTQNVQRNEPVDG